MGLRVVAKRCQQLPAGKDVPLPRSCRTRVSAPRLEHLEPSPADEVPVTRARYTAGAFAPPATRVAANDTSRTSASSRHRGAQRPHLKVGDGPLQQSTPLTDKQLEELSSEVLGSGSSVWSAEARNLPASTSDRGLLRDELIAIVRSASSRSGAISALTALTARGELDAVLAALQECDSQTLEVIGRRWQYSKFIAAAIESKKARLAVLLAKLLVPYCTKPELLLTAAMQACAQCRELDAGMAVLELSRKHGVKADTKMLTTLIKVCKSVGNVDKAFRVYQEMRTGQHQIDSHVYGALIATYAEAMKRDLTVVHERKDQFVLLERAFQFVADAEAAGVALETPAWNSLVVCAGRCGEVNRAFEVLTMMQRRGAEASAVTYGSLIEACVWARQPEKALRVFEIAMQKGFINEVKLYTEALSACKQPFPGAWERALEVYSALQRCPAVRPDKKFFACLITVAGRAGRLDTAFELLGEMAAEGIRPSSTTVSGIIHACMDRGNLGLARRVYDLCARQGVYPVPSQFNRMMDVYASEGRFGEVVSLLCDMVAAGQQPNLNTYRIVINACSHTDQAGLAFQVFALLHANKVPILQGKFAQTIYYMLVKACFNQTRFQWITGGYPPTPPPVTAAAATAAAAARGTGGMEPSFAAPDSAAAGGAGAASSSGRGSSEAAPSSSSHSGVGGSHAAMPAVAQQHHHHGVGVARSLPADRRLEAEKVLAALGGHKLRRGAHQSNPFDGPPDTIDWASHALSAFHHMLSRGFKPTLEMLDLLLNCMRAKMRPQDDLLGSVDGLGPGLGSAAYSAPFVHWRSRDEVFEVAFEPRALAVVEEAIARGLLPPFDPDAPLVLDMRRVPPVVAEAYILHILFLLERRAKRKNAQAVLNASANGIGGGSVGIGGGGGGSQQSYHHSITLLVPPFDPDLVKWPSHIERCINRYTALMRPEERGHLRHRSPFRRSRQRRKRALAAAAAPAGRDDNNIAAGVSDRDLGVGANEDDGEFEADDRLDSRTGKLHDPWVAEELYGWGHGLAGDTSDDDDDAAAEGTDPAGGHYVADSATGLAVAATLQRMKVWMDMDYVNGTITVFAVEIARWLKRRRQAVEAAMAARAAEDRADAGRGPKAWPGAGSSSAGPASPLGAAPGASPTEAASASDMVGPAAVGLMGAAAMVGARRMGLGRGPPGPAGAGTPVEQQQRNIRLGLVGGAAGRQAGLEHGSYGQPTGLPGHHQQRSASSGGANVHGGEDYAPAAAFGTRSRSAPSRGHASSQLRQASVSGSSGVQSTQAAAQAASPAAPLPASPAAAAATTTHGYGNGHSQAAHHNPSPNHVNGASSSGNGYHTKNGDARALQHEQQQQQQQQQQEQPTSHLSHGSQPSHKIDRRAGQQQQLRHQQATTGSAAVAEAKAQAQAEVTVAPGMPVKLQLSPQEPPAPMPASANVATASASSGV